MLHKHSQLFMEEITNSVLKINLIKLLGSMWS